MDNNVENSYHTDNANGHRSRVRRVGFFAAGIGLGSMIAYLVTRALRTRGPAAQLRENVVDDRGTGQEKAARMLRNLRDRAFEASDEKLALALGRPVEEVNAWNVGHELIDDDVVMKARGIALNRGVYIE
ncbi:MAG TPA: hypothetical protein VJV03_07835 [Pyrinomonadaceae bacterium]|nr:hypothetical protein [Pyrinomonadaceae bacterium]